MLIFAHLLEPDLLERPQRPRFCSWSAALPARFSQPFGGSHVLLGQVAARHLD